MKTRECPNHRGPWPWRTLPNGNENSIPTCIVISTQKQKLETLRKHPKNPQDIFKTNQGTPNTTRKSAENQTGDASKTTHGVSQNSLGLSKVTQEQPYKPTKIRLWCLQSWIKKIHLNQFSYFPKSVELYLAALYISLQPLFFHSLQARTCTCIHGLRKKVTYQPTP